MKLPKIMIGLIAAALVGTSFAAGESMSDQTKNPPAAEKSNECKCKKHCKKHCRKHCKHHQGHQDHKQKTADNVPVAQ